MSDKNPSMPEYVKQYLESLQADDRLPSPDVELEAYHSILCQIENEKNPTLKKLMQERLQNYCDGYMTGTHGMLLSYIKDEHWDQEVERERKILVLSNLYVDLEEILAGFSNSSVYTKQWGNNRRYPLQIPKKGGTPINATRVLIGDVIAPTEFLSSYYSFGSHKFYAGQALSSIIDFLEQRYGIDFEQLENNLIV